MRGKIVVAIVVILVAIILMLPKMILPQYISGELEKAWQKSLGAGFVRVNLDTKYGWELLTGRIRSVEVVAQDWEVADLPIETLHIAANNLHLDAKALLRDGRFVYLGADDLWATLSVTEAGINEYFWARVDPAKTFQVDLSEQGAHLRGNIEFFGQNLKAELLGQFVVEGETEISFQPQGLAVQETRVPDIFLEIISERYAASFNVGGLPIPMALERIDHMEGRILVYGIGVQ